MLNQEQVQERAERVFREATEIMNSDLNTAFRNTEFYDFYESFYHDIPWGEFGKAEVGKEIARYMGQVGLDFDVTLKGESVSYGRSHSTELIRGESAGFRDWESAEMSFLDRETDEDEATYVELTNLIDDYLSDLEETEGFKEMAQVWDFLLENTSVDETGSIVRNW